MRCQSMPGMGFQGLDFLSQGLGRFPKRALPDFQKGMLWRPILGGLENRRFEGPKVDHRIWGIPQGELSAALQGV